MSDSSSDPKLETLREQGALNPRPEDVRDPLFRENPFFDPRDLMQVKYEMVRRYQAEGGSATVTARAFGFSRVTFYQVLNRFKADGIGGLFPRLRGPKSAHKLSEELIIFLESALTENPMLGPVELAERIKGHFGTSIHPRSIARALARRQKKQRK